MSMKRVFASSLLGAAMLFSGVAMAQKPSKEPVNNINAHRHPNLAAAQRLTDQAYNKIMAAQQANEFDMDGHAQKAKDLLDQANRELKQAAEMANKDKK